MPIAQIWYQSGPNVECGMCASSAFFQFAWRGKQKSHLTLCDKLRFHLFTFFGLVQLLWKTFPVKQLAFHLFSSAIFNYQAVQMQ